MIKATKSTKIYKYEINFMSFIIKNIFRNHQLPYSEVFNPHHKWLIHNLLYVSSTSAATLNKHLNLIRQLSSFPTLSLRKLCQFWANFKSNLFLLTTGLFVAFLLQSIMWKTNHQKSHNFKCFAQYWSTPHNTKSIKG